MCLYSYYKEPYITDKDIVCYKYLVLSEDGKDLYTPYTKQKVCSVEEIIGHIQRPQQLFCFPTQFNYHYMIEKGAIHTYKYARDVRICYGEKRYMFKCIIPKGTKYWMGSNDDFCSRKIKYIEEITGKFYGV